MKLKEIQSYIETFQKTIKKSSEKEFLDLFEKADYFELGNKSFNKFSKEYFNVFLGIKENRIFSFVVNISDDFEKWTEETEVLTAEFKSFSDTSYNEFIKKYENQDTSKGETAIELKEVAERVLDWRKNKLKWFNKAKDSNELINYFQVPNSDFANGNTNTFFLGLENSNGNIDIIVGNPTGLYNFSRPVPPFEPIRF